MAHNKYVKTAIVYIQSERMHGMDNRVGYPLIVPYVGPSVLSANVRSFPLSFACCFVTTPSRCTMKQHPTDGSLPVVGPPLLTWSTLEPPHCLGGVVTVRCDEKWPAFATLCVPVPMPSGHSCETREPASMCWCCCLIPYRFRSCY